MKIFCVSVNPLYLVIGGIHEYIKESDGNKYLIFDFTDKIEKN